VSRSLAEIAALGALAAAPEGLSAEDLVRTLADAGVSPDESLVACESLAARGAISVHGRAFALTPAGGSVLLAVYSDIERALDPSPTTPGMQECPSLPWLTTVQTHWLDAVSLNYAVDPARLAAILPAPLEPEIHHGSAWVQVLASRLREMRPQGMPALFGVNFHQVSYRAAVRYRGSAGIERRGGYFVRSETDHVVMRAVGNALVEFRFHDFELSRVSLERRGDSLEFLVEPSERPERARLRASLDVRAGQRPPLGSSWASVEQMQHALVDCYDAFGVDPAGWVYVLTIDRDSWRARFASPTRPVVARWIEDGPLAGARLDSVLHIPSPCGYRWRPLRRERFAP
jgi:uncharacterized protein YqjF (DUF2071 family)